MLETILMFIDDRGDICVNHDAIMPAHIVTAMETLMAHHRINTDTVSTMPVDQVMRAGNLARQFAADVVECACTVVRANVLGEPPEDLELPAVRAPVFRRRYLPRLRRRAWYYLSGG